MEDKKDSIIKILICIIVILIAALILLNVFYKKEVPSNPAPGPSTNEPVVDANSIIGGYSYSVIGDENSTEYSLFLRSDNTFRLDVASEFSKHYVGTYEVKDNSVLLNTHVYYESNGCYFKQGAKLNADKFVTLTTILNDNNITFDYFGEKITLSKSNLKVESDEELNIYNVNVQDNDLYTDCTDKTSI